METPNKSFMPVIIAIICGILLFLFGIVWLIQKKKGWGAIITTYAIAVGIVIIIGLIIGAIVWLLKTQRLDMVHIHKQRIIASCSMNRPSFKQSLMFKGSDELEGRVIGEVLGVAMTKSVPVLLTDEQKDDMKKTMDSKQIKEFTRPKQLYWIAFKRTGFMTPPELFCGNRDDFTHLSGSIIYLNGMAFAPPLYDVYFLAKRFQQTEMIDETVTFAIRRYVLQEFLKEEKNIFDDVLAISPQHQKALEQSRMRTIQGDLAPPPQQGGKT